MAKISGSADNKTLSQLEKELAQQEEQIKLLEQSELKYRHFFEKSPTMIYVVDRSGMFVNLNQAGAEMLGYESPEDILGKRFDDYFKTDERDLRSYQATLEEIGSLKGVEAILKCSDGSCKYVQISAALRKTLTGKVKGYEGFVIDTTVRKAAERRLAESETRYRTVLDNSLAAIYMFQNGGFFSYVNPRMVRILGYDSVEELIGKPFWEIIATKDRDMVKARGLEREHKEISPRRYKYRMLKKNGEEIWVDMRASHASYLGRPAAVGNFIDITKEVRAEEQVRHMTRQLIDGIEEERRSLANDIHDEFGQSLTSLQFEMESLINLLSKDQPVAVSVCLKVTEQIQQIADKVRDTTSKLRPDLLDHLGLDPTLRWYIKDVAKRRPDMDISYHTVGLKRRLPADVELVLYRVFQEGLNNIIKHANARVVSLQLTYSHPDIIFIIKDDGCGFQITGDELSGQDPRQGIGLMSMKERVATLSGTLTVRSSPGKGTVLRIKIPMSEIQPDESN